MVRACRVIRTYHDGGTGPWLDRMHKLSAFWALRFARESRGRAWRSRRAQVESAVSSRKRRKVTFQISPGWWPNYIHTKLEAFRSRSSPNPWLSPIQFGRTAREFEPKSQRPLWATPRATRPGGTRPYSGPKSWPIASCPGRCARGLRGRSCSFVADRGRISLRNERSWPYIVAMMLLMMWCCGESFFFFFSVMMCTWCVLLLCFFV